MLVEFVPVIEIRFQNLCERAENTFLYCPLLLNQFSFLPCTRDLGRVPLDLRVLTILESVFDLDMLLLFFAKFQSIECEPDVIHPTLLLDFEQTVSLHILVVALLTVLLETAKSSHQQI